MGDLSAMFDEPISPPGERQPPREKPRAEKTVTPRSTKGRDKSGKFVRSHTAKAGDAAGGEL